MSGGIIDYDESLPVTRDWIDEHAGKYATFRVWVTLEDLIEVDLQGLNELMDAYIGATLTDIDYQVIQPEPLEEIGPNEIKLQVTGEVAEF